LPTRSSGGSAIAEKRELLQVAGSQSIERIEPQILPQLLLQHRQRPPRDALDEPFDLLQLGLGQSPKLDVALLVFQEDRVRREGMEVGAAVQSGAEQLGEADSRGRSAAQAQAPGLQLLPGAHRPHEDRPHLPEQPAIPRQQEPQTEGQGQDPLPIRREREHSVDQVGRRVVHPAPKAGRAESHALA
jgi:hypothetical protein